MRAGDTQHTVMQETWAVGATARAANTIEVGNQPAYQPFCNATDERAVLTCLREHQAHSDFTTLH